MYRLPIRATCPAHLELIVRIIFYEDKNYVRGFLQPPVTSSSLDPYILLSTQSQTPSTKILPSGRATQTHTKHQVKIKANMQMSTYIYIQSTR
jgi:hypothetical protein